MAQVGVELFDGVDGRSAGFGAGLRVDQHLLEEGLVHELLDVRGRIAVGAGAVFEEVECSLEVCLGDGVVGRELLEFMAHTGEAAGDAVLFASEQVERDGAGVVGLQELVLFSAQMGFLGCDGFAVLDAVALGAADLVEHDGLDLAALLGGEGDALVDGVDLAFDFVDEDAAELAACGVVFAAVAVEVGVDLSGAGGGHLDDHP